MPSQPRYTRSVRSGSPARTTSRTHKARSARLGWESTRKSYTSFGTGMPHPAMAADWHAMAGPVTDRTSGHRLSAQLDDFGLALQPREPAGAARGGSGGARQSERPTSSAP